MRQLKKLTKGTKSGLKVPGILPYLLSEKLLLSLFYGYDFISQDFDIIIHYDLGWSVCRFGHLDVFLFFSISQSRFGSSAVP